MNSSPSIPAQPGVYPQEDGSLVVHFPGPVVGPQGGLVTALMNDPHYRAHLRLMNASMIVQRVRDLFAQQPGVVSFDVHFWFDASLRRTEPVIEELVCKEGENAEKIQQKLKIVINQLLEDFSGLESMVTDIFSAPLDRETLDQRFRYAWDEEFGEGDFSRRTALETATMLENQLAPGLPVSGQKPFRL